MLKIFGYWAVAVIINVTYNYFFPLPPPTAFIVGLASGCVAVILATRE